MTFIKFPYTPRFPHHFISNCLFAWLCVIGCYELGGISYRIYLKCSQYSNIARAFYNSESKLKMIMFILWAAIQTSSHSFSRNVVWRIEIILMIFSFSFTCNLYSRLFELSELLSWLIFSLSVMKTMLQSQS